MPSPYRIGRAATNTAHNCPRCNVITTSVLDAASEIALKCKMFCFVWWWCAFFRCDQLCDICSSNGTELHNENAYTFPTSLHRRIAEQECYRIALFHLRHRFRVRFVRCAIPIKTICVWQCGH